MGSSQKPASLYRKCSPQGTLSLRVSQIWRPRSPSIKSAFHKPLDLLRGSPLLQLPRRDKSTLYYPATFLDQTPSPGRLREGEAPSRKRYQYREFDARRESFNRCGLDTPGSRPGTRIWKCNSTRWTRQGASASSPINSAACRSNVRD
jgi:hypothetical protein